ncbi:hypothetical protein Dda_5235 [Drechslerella dactyloides]|uniref:PLD phosphodiesterase domain-containing protein n=1 Tax=Drechslerella dactyloides TaxID=74499 RepID=A0AAD6NIN5_DREDA|nr:hypothetical protein Dda_5235 [Drechslerella dactyloides]
MPTMIPESVQKLCASEVSVTSLMNEDPTLTPAKAYDKLVRSTTPIAISALKQKHAAKCNEGAYGDVLDGDLEDARACGNFEGTQPSRLFLKIFYHVLRTLEKDPRAGVVSPRFLGTTGVVPLTIMSIIPDIMRHYANLIIRAQKSIIIATNFWAASNASHIITDALKELSKRRLEVGLPPVDVKILYDRGNLKQTVKNHVDVNEKEYNGDKVQIPRQEEVQGLTLQVVNFHVPPVGTFHAKWMVVDGRIAILNSNNIQYEGAIVDAFYDSALISWHNALNPALEVHKFFSEDEGRSAFEFADAHTSKMTAESDVTEETLRLRDAYLRYHKDFKSEEWGRNGKDLVPFAAQLADLNLSPGVFNASNNGHAKAVDTNDDLAPGLDVSPAQPIYNEARPELHQARRRTPPAPVLQRASNTSHISRAIATEENQDEVARAHDESETGEPPGQMLAAREDAYQIEYDDNFSSEAERVKGLLGTIDKVTRHLNTSIQPSTKGTLLETDAEAHIEEFSPVILHSRHKPFPIAMVNRRPLGCTYLTTAVFQKGRNTMLIKYFAAPGHQSLRVPQNEAWIAGLRLAEKQVFIQTPDLNASDLVELIPQTVKRGVEVVIYLTLGYNDAGEMLPFQNGTNEQIVCSLFEALPSEEEKERLKVYWYTAKDMRTPLHAKTKQRTSHIKLMTVDGHIGIQGSGNQDTQSWYHSQETNVMIDSKEVVREWLWGIRSNQNTHLCGRVDNDGVWRAREGRDMVGENGNLDYGEQIPWAMGGGKIRFGWMKGVKGAIERVQGVGGF